MNNSYKTSSDIITLSIIIINELYTVAIFKSPILQVYYLKSNLKTHHHNYSPKHYNTKKYLKKQTVQFSKISYSKNDKEILWYKLLSGRNNVNNVLTKLPKHKYITKNVKYIFHY